ncbi:MAG: galactose-1-epimerase, partial [Clostridia bacterium]|nr:galactose-1-epimerase [Clostridia bacterium]
YDHNFILDRKKQEIFEGVKLNLAAVCKVPERKMTVLTSKPCMQVYTGNFLGNGPDFKGGVKQQQHHAVCFETQFEPNDPADPNGKSYLTPDKKYRHITVYRID